jgi:hypothetical protein
MKAKEIANQLTKDLCEKNHVQWLDESIYFRKVSLRRQENGWLNFKREYDFEYSEDGLGRNRGRIILLGHQKIAARLDKTPVHPSSLPESRAPAKIIKFDKFRKSEKNKATEAKNTES